jgi:hypothetical protein
MTPEEGTKLIERWVEMYKEALEHDIAKQEEEDDE